MPSISFAQAFAINKGANFVNLIPFKGIPIKSLLNGITLQSLPGSPNYVPDIHNENSLTYTLANTSDTFNSQLVFKYGGDIGSVNVQTISNQITSYIVPNSTSQGIKYGDFVYVNFAVGNNTPGNIYLNGRLIELETGTSNVLSIIGSRAQLVGNYNNTQPSFSGSVVGYVSFTTPIKTTMYWTGFVNPKQANSEYFDFRVAVGYFREHTGANGPSYHPQNGGTQQIMGFDGLIGYHMFVDVNDNLPKWWAIVGYKKTDTQVFEIIAQYPTNVLATSYNTLQVETTNTSYIFKVNGNTIGSSSLINSAIYDTESLPLLASVVLRAMKYAQSGNTLPIDKPLKVSTDNLVWVNTVIPSEGNPSLSETGLHTTGLRLLKKLK